MGKGFHMGEYIKGVLDEHQVKYAGLARAMEVTPQAVSGMFERERIGDDVLIRVGNGARIDLLGMVRREQARLMGKKGDPPPSVVSEPITAYGRRGMELVVNLDEYDEATQLKILRYLQQQEKKTR